MKPTNIKYILFDIGNVLFVDTELIFDKMFGRDRLSQADQEKYVNMIHATERGERPVEDLLKIMAKIFKRGLTPKQVERFMTTTVLIPAMWKLANDLRKNYSVMFLTNNQKDWPEKQAAIIGVDIKPFKIFNSAKLGMRKPGSEIFEYVTKKLKARPEEILFIDDRGYNLVEPKKLGWKTIHFTGDMKAVYRALKKYGVKVKL
jgi:FMN phosphatase YigB (HAD superfamily)